MYRLTDIRFRKAEHILDKYQELLHENFEYSTGLLEKEFHVFSVHSIFVIFNSPFTHSLCTLAVNFLPARFGRFLCAPLCHNAPPSFVAMVYSVHRSVLSLIFSVFGEDIFATCHPQG